MSALSINRINNTSNFMIADNGHVKSQVKVITHLKFAESARYNPSCKDIKKQIIEIGSSLRVTYLIAALVCAYFSVSIPIWFLGMAIINESINRLLDQKINKFIKI